VDRLRYGVSPSVRASVSADGLVLLDVRGGLVLASNPIGARIWTLIEQTHTSPEIAQELCRRYDIPLDRAQDDVLTFVAALVERGLVTEDRS
jgi:hypothetical protein